MVDIKSQIVSPECTGCLRCVNACPVDGTLLMNSRGLKKTWNEKTFGVIVIGIYLITVYLAIITGHWKAGVSEQEYQMLIPRISSQDVHHTGNPSE
jgi:Fe-S-cluster-containing hydrogenase component 2